MYINNFNINKQFSFKSRNCPVAPFTIITTKGNLFVEEIKKRDLDKTLSFYLEVLLESVKSWEHLRNPSEEKRLKHMKYLKSFLTHCLEKEDGNSTILIAKDASNNVKAITDLQYYDEVDFLSGNGFKDLKTGYIQNCYIAPEYRSQGIGQMMLGKTLKTAENHFTDIFLCSEHPAVNFYKKAGFSVLDTTNPLLKKIIDYILPIRGDGNYVTPMSKIIDPEKPWWDRMIKLIK